jgi:hypothetical protein
MQLRGEFGAGCARADDRNVKLAGTDGAKLGLGAGASVDEAPIEARSVRRRFQRHRMLGNAGSAVVVGEAADCDDECVVTDSTRWDELAASSSKVAANALPSSCDQPDHLAEAIVEPVPMRLGEVAQPFSARERVPAATVQQRLPYVSPVAVDERYLLPAAPP